MEDFPLRNKSEQVDQFQKKIQKIAFSHPILYIYIKSQRIKAKSKKCSCHILPYFSISFLAFFARTNQPTHPSIHPSAFLFPSRISVNSKPNCRGMGDAKKQIALQESLCALYPPQFHTVPFCPPHQKKSRGGGGGGASCLRPRSFLLPPYLFPLPFFLSFLKLRPYSRVQEVGQRLSLRLARTRDTEWKGFSPHKRAR